MLQISTIVYGGYHSPAKSAQFCWRAFVGCGDSTHRCRVGGTKSSEGLFLTVRRDSPCGCPLSAQPINNKELMLNVKSKPRFSNLCKVEASNPVDFYNQTFNSRAAVFESYFREARERLAKQDARARTRSSSGAFARECAELPIESRELCTAARRCGCRAGTARLLFFCRRFLFQTKRKCRNVGSAHPLIRVRSEGRS